jgi:(2Fe-2S) ferredoxin
MPRNLNKTSKHVLICNGKTCYEAGGEKLTEAVEDEIMEKEIEEQIHVTKTFCNGRCKDKCAAVVYPEGVWYKGLVPEDAMALVDAFAENEQLWEKVSYRYDGEVFSEMVLKEEDK